MFQRSNQPDPPRRPVVQRGLCVLAVVAALASFTTTWAAEVEIQVSSKEVAVGIGFTLVIEIAGATDYETPTLPEMSGLRVTGPPGSSRRSFTSSVNGRVTQRESVALTWTLVATEPGSLTIPPVTVIADGDAFTSRPIEINATRPEDGDVMFMEITTNRERLYLGEPARLTLRIWIRQYRNERLGKTLGIEEMLARVRRQRSSWGEFEEPMRSGFRGTQVGRTDANGIERPYFRYELTTTLWPTQAGPLEVQPVTVLLDYPTSSMRSRSLFDRGDLRITGSKPVVATAEPPAVEIVTPPEAGRPATFAGAVGRFDVAVTAKPTLVAVGDPITMTITVTDETPEGAPMDVLAAPPLDAVPDLTRDFRVPGDPLAGAVAGRTKTFTQTVRARHDGVTAIPPIPFSYFDPVTERFETAISASIPIQVSPAVTISMADVVGGSGSGVPRATELTAVSGGLLANVSGPDRLLVDQRFRAGWVAPALLAVPPVAFAALALGRRQVRRRRGDTAYARRRSARRNALRRIAEAERSDAELLPERVALAIGAYVADRCRAPAGALTRAEIVERIRRSGAADDVADDVGTLLAQCEEARFAGQVLTNGDGLAQRALRCIERLERERIA